MWGVDANKVGTSSVLILNTTDPDAITVSEQYIDPNIPNLAKESASTGLSTGAKAGIIVAAVVVVRSLHMRLANTRTLYSCILLIGHLGRSCHLVLSSQKKKRKN